MYHRRERTTEDGTTEDGQSRGLLKFNSRLTLYMLLILLPEMPSNIKLTITQANVRSGTEHRQM